MNRGLAGINSRDFADFARKGEPDYCGESGAQSNHNSVDQDGRRFRAALGFSDEQSAIFNQQCVMKIFG
jgi:hypothetical protein